MKRRIRTTNGLAALALLALAIPVTAAAAPKRDRALEAALLAHITVLASDEYGGREPGTDGEAKTLRYLARQWFDIGLESGTNDPAHEWFAPVTLVARAPTASSAAFTRKGRRLYVPADAQLVLTSGERALVENAPVLFVGNGAGAVPTRGEMAGRVALILDGGTDDSLRQNALLAGGASAVLTVLDGDRTLEQVSARRSRQGYALATAATGGDLEGFVTGAAFDRILTGSGQSVASLRRAAQAPGFVPRALDLAVSLEAATRATTILTHNLIGRLPGRRSDAGAVLLVAHWDHFGTCAQKPAEDTICNGAVDNASGLAVLTEIARRLARGPQMDRDVIFLATTGEELGLLGAEAFAENPPLPLPQIVAAFNIDTVAVNPAGTPLGVVGQGRTALDAGIAAVARAQRRAILQSDAPNGYLKRQDGWALLQHDIPAVMVSSAYGDMTRLEAYMDKDYHRPSDRVKPGLELGGAAEDTAFHVALVRWFADSRKVALPRK